MLQPMARFSQWFGVKLQEHCKTIGIPCELNYPGAPDVKHATPTDFLVAKLTAK